MVVQLANSMTRHLGLSACGTILLAITVGTVWRPSFLRNLIPVAVLLVLYPFMFDLEMHRLKTAMIRPVALLTALIVNLVLSPLLAFAISYTFFPAFFPWLTIGVVLFGSVPCGGMVPAYTGMLRGDVNLAVTITALSLFLSIVTVPLWSKILLGTLVPVPALLIAKYLFVIIVAPFLLATLTRSLLLKLRGPRSFAAFREKITALSGPGLMLFIFIIFVLHGDTVRKDPVLILKIALPVSLLLAILLTVGHVFARYFKIPVEAATALQCGIAVKNTAVAIALSFTSFDAKVPLVLAISGPLAQLPTMLLYLRWKKHRLRHSKIGSW